ncbi:hypothetical protein, partial [Candidatus Enterococcus willemsii]|uniref:hypothetical protein n=1 Tax=Candidatus Enterococcus willemsii TaxID=1857215 RepID=UPI001F3BA6BF
RSNTQVTNVFVSSQINHYKVLNKHNVINDEEYGKLLTCLLNVPKIHLQNNYAEELENLYDLLQGKILSFEQFKNRKNLILNQLAQECDKYTNFNTEELSKENSMSKN